jgi:acyl carrier protein|tara:strand:+ start:696 stop:926 length:231 start_codon:yes stop_codon:yes gene_type:complete
MQINFEKIIIKYIFSKISKNKIINKNTKFDDIKEFDSLNLVKLIIYLNKYNINLDAEKLSKIKNIKDLINVCKKSN